MSVQVSVTLYNWLVIYSTLYQCTFTVFYCIIRISILPPVPSHYPVTRREMSVSVHGDDFWMVSAPKIAIKTCWNQLHNYTSLFHFLGGNYVSFAITVHTISYKLYTLIS